MDARRSADPVLGVRVIAGVSSRPPWWLVARLACLFGLAFALLVAAARDDGGRDGVGRSAAQTPSGGLSSEPFYVMPLWLQYASASDAEFALEASELRRRLGPEGPFVRLGFTAYVHISMTDWRVDPADSAAVRRALPSTVEQVDRAIDRARRHGLPLCLSFLTAIRERTDSVQQAAEAEDLRNVQWYSDNSPASGWVTYSRYARALRRVQEAYWREIGRLLANRMARDPNLLVAASGDGEIELSYERSPFGGRPYTAETTQVADYSPFAVAEFRDWLRHGGLYAPGQPFAGEGYALGRRYAGDRSPADDTNGDGHTLNGDFGTRFTSWRLRYFDWSLDDPVERDPRAIRASAGASPARTAPVDAGIEQFDAPRTRRDGDPWWEVWMTFRQQMVWHHNRDIARWVTTSRDPATGARVPPTRWYSDQIPADWVFGHSPQEPDLRFVTSASAWWTADVAPFGTLGITAFAANTGGVVNRTLRQVAPLIGARDIRWGILEWHPSVPEHPSLQVYLEEVELVERFRPALVVPIYWGDPTYRIQDSGFEVALRELVARTRNGFRPLPATVSVDPTRLTFGVTSDGRFSTPPQRVRVAVLARGQWTWQVASDAEFLAVEPREGTGVGEVTVSIRPGSRPPGELRGRLRVESPGASPVWLEVVVRVYPAGATRGPHGVIDVPSGDLQTTAAVVSFAGWVLDDLGVERVEIWRDPVVGERAGDHGLVFVGRARFKTGARPDVEAAFPDAPRRERAAWGFDVATASLPNEGNGTFRFHVVAYDVEGHRSVLGTRTVTRP